MRSSATRDGVCLPHVDVDGAVPLQTLCLGSDGEAAGIVNVTIRCVPRQRCSTQGWEAAVVVVRCRKKVPSEEPAFRLAGMELLKIDTPVYHISRYLPAVRQSTAPFSFVMCLTLPYARRILALVIIFEADGMLGAAAPSDDDDEDDEEKLSPFDLCMARFPPPPPIRETLTFVRLGTVPPLHSCSIARPPPCR